MKTILLNKYTYIMKNKIVIALGLLLFSTSLFAQAQNLKIGYTNVEYILTQLPEYKQIEADLGSYTKQLETQLQSKMTSFQQKYQEYMQTAESMTEVVRKDKEEELQNLQSSIEKFRRDADQSIQKKQADLVQPAYDKIQKAIENVAKENSFTHIFSDGAGMVNVLLYAREDDDVTDLVLAKLGVSSQTKNE
jgi:outer membrane protein